MMKRHNNTIITQLCARTACGPHLSEPTCNIDQCSVGKQPAASQWEPRCRSARGCWRSLNNKTIDRFQPEPQHPRVDVVGKQSLVCMYGGDRTSAALLSPSSSSLHVFPVNAAQRVAFPFRPSQSAAARHDGPPSNRDSSYFRSAVLNFRQTW